MTPAVERAFKELRNDDVVRYVDYWDSITPRTPAEIFRRFLFAFCSVHTTWEGNVKGYEEIKNYKAWLGAHDGLRTRLVRAGCGMHNHRAEWIGAFAEDFWSSPGAYQRGLRESWSSFRDRLVSRIKGLGPAKVSFALELAYPLEAEVVCLDVHMLRMYGRKDQNLRVHEYERYEHDWLGRSRAAGLPPYIVKQVSWDALQGRPDSRYWSYVLEN